MDEISADIQVMFHTVWSVLNGAAYAAQVVKKRIDLIRWWSSGCFFHSGLGVPIL